MSTVEVRQDTVKPAAPRSPAGEAFNEVLVLVLRLNGSFTAAGEALAKTAGQTLARWVVLDQCRDAAATVSDKTHCVRIIDHYLRAVPVRKGANGAAEGPVCGRPSTSQGMAHAPAVDSAADSGAPRPGGYFACMKLGIVGAGRVGAACAFAAAST